MKKLFTVTSKIIEPSYGDDAATRSRSFEWFSKFQDGKELTEDDERSMFKWKWGKCSACTIVDDIRPPTITDTFEKDVLHRLLK